MLATLGTLLGGLGLFLLAVSMMTEGLKLAAGNALRGMLARSTRTTSAGMASGAFVTALVQSSSAVTVATIGFVNAGLLATVGGLSIVLGATLGTTMTGWLVAGVGFQFDIAAFALPLVGVGVLLRLLGPSRRMGAIGEALAGFGLFFIGVDFLRDAFDGLTESLDMTELDLPGLAGVLLFTGIGLIMTLLTQSSSAAVAIALSAVSGGLISFPAAAATIIGSMVGTTSTSALAVIGATANAKRIAAGHVLVNSVSSLMGLALLPVLLSIVSGNEVLEASPALTLAAFHTGFTICGVLVMTPFLPRLAAFLDRRFINPVEELGRPRHLDSNVIASPVLAMDAFLLELRRMAGLSRSHACRALAGGSRDERRLTQQAMALQQLVQQVEYFVSALETGRLQRHVTIRISMVLRIVNYIDEMVIYAGESLRDRDVVNALGHSDMHSEVRDYREAVIEHIGRCDPEREGFDVAELEQEYQALREHWRSLKSRLLDAGVDKRLAVLHLNPAIDSLRVMLRVAERATRIAVRLSELKRHVPGRMQESQAREAAPEAPDTGVGTD